MTASGKYLAMLSLFVGVFFVKRDLGVDIWFMFNNSQYIWANGFPQVEPFTLHENLSYMVQQWLTGMIFEAVRENFGYAGLVWLARLMGAGIVYGYYRLCLKISGGNHPLSLVLAGSVGLFVCLVFVCTRPVIFSSLVLIAEVLTLEAAQTKPRLLWLLPVWSVLLINFHAAVWGMFLVLLLPYVLAAYPMPRLAGFVETGINLPVKKTVAAAALGIVAAAVFNPYGITALGYGARSYGHTVINEMISEMRPLDVHSALFVLPAAFLLFLLPAYGRRPVPLQYPLLTVGTAYMALAAIRSEIMFLLFGTLGTAYVLRDVKWASVEGFSLGDKWLRLWLTATVTLVAATAVIRSDDEEDRFPEYYYGEIYKEAGDFLTALPEGKENIRLLTNYDCGSYMEYRGIKCYIDTRAEVFLAANNKQKDIFHEFAYYHWCYLPHRKLLWRYDFTHILITEDNLSLYYALAHDPRLELIFEFNCGSGKEPCTGRIYKVNKEQ